MRNWVLPGLLAMLMVTFMPSWSQEFGYPERDAVPWYFVSIDYNSVNEIGAGPRASRRPYGPTKGFWLIFQPSRRYVERASCSIRRPGYSGPSCRIERDEGRAWAIWNFVNMSRSGRGRILRPILTAWRNVVPKAGLGYFRCRTP